MCNIVFYSAQALASLLSSAVSSCGDATTDFATSWAGAQRRANHIPRAYTCSAPSLRMKLTNASFANSALSSCGDATEAFATTWAGAQRRASYSPRVCTSNVLSLPTRPTNGVALAYATLFCCAQALASLQSSAASGCGDTTRDLATS